MLRRIALCCLFRRQQPPSRPNLRHLQDGPVDVPQAKTMVAADARRSVVMEGAGSRLLLRQIRIENRIALVSPHCGIPKKKRRLFALGTISCTPDRRMFTEKLVFYCLVVTWGMRRRVLLCSLAPSNSCTARNSCKTTVDTFPPQFGRPFPLRNRESKLACLA